MNETPHSSSTTSLYDSIYQTLAELDGAETTSSMPSIPLQIFSEISQEEAENTPKLIKVVSYLRSDDPTLSLFYPNNDKLEEEIYPSEESFECPLWYDCDWSGRKRDIYAHCKAIHPQSVYESGSWFVCPAYTSGKYIVHDKGNIFFFFTEKKRSGDLVYDIQYIEKPKEFVKYAFELLQQDVPSMVVRRKLGFVKKCSGRLRNHSNNILAGDFYRFLFKEVEVQELKCRRCNEVMQCKFQVDKTIWNCFQCPDRVQSCSNWFEGCIFVDFQAKAKSHEKLFCYFNKKCVFCPSGSPGITQSSLFLHYSEDHKQLLRKSYFTYTSSQSCITTLLKVQQCMLAVECKMRRTYMLRITIFLEFISALSRYYKLFVTVKDPQTDVEKMFPTKLVHYWQDNNGADWYLQIDIAKEFVNWSGCFIIEVSIKRKLSI